MAVVNVTLTAGVTVHYWFTPQAIFDVSAGNGVASTGIVSGWSAWVDGTSEPQLTFELDNAFQWDVSLEFRNAEPITFEGFQPGNGGDLLELLSAQGWTP